MKNSVFFLFLSLATCGKLNAQHTTYSARSGWVTLKKAPATAPTISWQTPLVRQVTEYKRVGTVTVRILSADTLTRVQFFNNGTELVGQARGYKRVNGGVEVSRQVQLVVGTNEIQVRATNAAGSTTSEPRIVICQPEITPTTQAGQKRLALVLANESYQKGPLKNPLNDGRLIKQQLESLGFRVIYKENLPLRDLEQTFVSFLAELGSHNVGLFYYAGHGIMVNGENFILPINADPKAETDVKYECYPLRQLADGMVNANPKGTNLLFWDACRNNPYRSWRRGIGEETNARVPPPSGTIFVYATEPGKQAYDGDEENGLFTSELVKHISQPNVDIYELVERIELGLEDRGFRQFPYLEGRTRGGRFVFKTE